MLRANEIASAKLISSIKRISGKVYIKIDSEGKTFYFDVSDMNVYERNRARIDYLKMFKRLSPISDTQ